MYMRAELIEGLYDTALQPIQAERVKYDQEPDGFG